MFKGKLPTTFYLWHTIVHLCHIILSFPWALIEKRGFLTYSKFSPEHLYRRGSRSKNRGSTSKRELGTNPILPAALYFHFQILRHLDAPRPGEGAEPRRPAGYVTPAPLLNLHPPTGVTPPWGSPTHTGALSPSRLPHDLPQLLPISRNAPPLR